MKMLTVSLLVCAMMALALAVDEEIPVDKELNNTATLQHLCPDGFSHYEGRCYRFVPDLLTWAEAEKDCVTRNSNLVSVHSMNPTFHTEWRTRMNASSVYTWIGGSDCQQDNVWLWSDGKEFSKTNWCPSVAPGYKHGCIALTHDDATCWVNRECSDRYPYVCAHNMGDVLQTPSSPTPAGVTE